MNKPVSFQLELQLVEPQFDEKADEKKDLHEHFSSTRREYMCQVM